MRRRSNHKEGLSDTLVFNYQVNRRSAVLPLLAAAAFGVSVASIPFSTRADSVETGQLLLRLKFKPGDSLKYQTNMQLGFTLPMPTGAKPAAVKSGDAANSLGGTTFAVNATQDIRVRRAGAEGGGDLDVTTTGQNSLPGQPPILSNDTRPVLMTYDALGKLTDIRRQGETASGNPMFSAMLGQGLLSMQGVILPLKAVKVGETWTQKMQIPGVTGGGSSTIKTTLARVETINKYRTARLHVVITTPVNAYLDAALQPVAKPSGAASTMTGTAVVTDDINFAIAEGRVVRSSSKGVTTMSVAIGKPTIPAAPAKTKRKSGAKAAPAPTAPVKTGQTLQMTVRTDIETNLVEPAKKIPGT